MSRNMNKFRLRLWWGQGNEEFELAWVDEKTWEALISAQPHVKGVPVVYRLHANEIRLWPDTDHYEHLIVRIEQVTDADPQQS